MSKRKNIPNRHVKMKLNTVEYSEQSRFEEMKWDYERGQLAKYKIPEFKKLLEKYGGV